MENRIALIIDEVFDTAEVDALARVLSDEYPLEILGPGSLPPEESSTVAEGRHPTLDRHAAEYAGLVIAGAAPAWRSANVATIGLLQAFDQNRHPIAAASYGVDLLRVAGLANGRSVAAPDRLAPVLRKAGADVVPDVVAVDGNWVTSRGTEDAVLLAETFVERLAEMRSGGYVPDYP